MVAVRVYSRIKPPFGLIEGLLDPTGQSTLPQACLADKMIEILGPTAASSFRSESVFRLTLPIFQNRLCRPIDLPGIVTPEEKFQFLPKSSCSQQ
jgi:hypothetical protein